MPHYREVLYRNYSENFGGSRAVERCDPSRHFHEYSQTYQQHLPSDRKAEIVDLGCGQGDWLAWVHSLGYENLRGVDVSARELTFATEVNVEVGEAHEVLQKHSGKFDLIHAKDIIEHMTKQEMVDLVLAAATALRPDGQLWIATFNGQAPFAAYTWHGDFTHESSLTPKSLGQLLRACGLEVVSVRGVTSAASFKGRVRNRLWDVFTKPLQFAMTCGYGSEPQDGTVETRSMLPAMLGIGRKQTSR